MTRKWLMRSKVNPVYLDYAATTPLDPRVIACMVDCLQHDFGNPASTHVYGVQAKKWVETANVQVADLLNVNPEEIIWTSGATEANNLAIKGVAQAYAHRGKHAITLSTEHKSVLDPYHALERQGFSVSYLKPETNGLLDIAKLEAAIRSDTILISVMHVNNEIGVIQDLMTIGKLAKKLGILLHVDAAQSFGRLPIDLKMLAIDLLSFSGHKIYGPKGVGGLFVRKDPPLRLTPQIHGGGHQRNFRSGTLATHQIAGLGKACEIAKEEMAKDDESNNFLRKRFWQGIQDLPDVKLNMGLNYSASHILNVSFLGVKSEDLLAAMPELALATGSACNAATMTPSYVLRSLGLNKEVIQSAVRISVGRFTKLSEIDQAVELISKTVHNLRKS